MKNQQFQAIGNRLKDIGKPDYHWLFAVSKQPDNLQQVVSLVKLYAFCGQLLTCISKRGM